MRLRAIFLILLFVTAVSADDLEKTQKKQLESQVKTMTAEAQKLEKSGQLAEARIKYAESQALIEMKEVTDSIKRLDGEIEKRVKDVLSSSRKLYESKKYSEAAASLEAAMKLQAYQTVISYNLAFCYFQTGDRVKALDYLRKAKAGTPDPKQKQKVSELLTYFTTGEKSGTINDATKAKYVKVNHLSENIGIEAYLEDTLGDDEVDPDAVAPATGAAPAVAQPPAKTNSASAPHGNNVSAHRASLCNALAEMKPTIVTTPSGSFDLANCAETNGRTAEAITLLEKYLELSPAALDADDVHARIADLKSLQTLQGPSGIETRRLYGSVYTALAERKYDRALADLIKAGEVTPDFNLTKWRLGLLYEAMGNVAQARENFTRYQELTPDQSLKDEAALHLTTLDAKRSKYDEEIDSASDILSDLFNRGLNLTFNEPPERRSLRVQRAKVTKKEQNKAKNRVGGFAIPFPYAQQQLTRASDHLQIALALCPLGAEANELMGLVYLQANDGGSATRNFDVVSTQDLPVSFYAEMRGHKQDHAVKCELTNNGMRMIFLSTYDKNGRPTPPAKPAGEDGLGDLVVEPSGERLKEFDSLSLTSADIQKVETNRGLIKLKLAKEDLYLAPIFLPTFTPVDGPPARRFANNYTRLFVRYPGLEDSKLGTEGMSGGEKFQMGYKIATASMDIAMSGFNPMGAISSVQDAISIARTIHSAMASLTVTFATWEKSVDDQQRLLSGKSFKAIPTQPVTLAFVQDIK